jgi:DegT/DnrJ/EryC1/StrS aminotransferase family protein
MNLDPTDLERHITANTKVILAVHILGASADMDPVLAIARKHKLRVLEDCAQSDGVTYKGRPGGSMGDCAILQLPDQQDYFGSRRWSRGDELSLSARRPSTMWGRCGTATPRSLARRLT